MTFEDRTDHVFVSDGELRMWIDGGIHLKASTAHGDPVELSREEAQDVVDGLLRLIANLNAG